MARKNSEAGEAMTEETRTGEAMTEETRAGEVRPDMEELVDYTAPLTPWMTNRDIFAAVNGETIRIKRGTPVKIKRKFLEVLQNAAVQEMKAYEYKEATKKDKREAAAKL